MRQLHLHHHEGISLTNMTISMPLDFALDAG